MRSGVEAAALFQFQAQQVAEGNRGLLGDQFTQADLEELDVPSSLVNLGDEDLIMSWLRQQEMED